jgi:hypothetical protein
MFVFAIGSVTAVADDSAAMERRHWSFQPIAPVAVPRGEPTWSDHPIDRFIAAKWREQELQPILHLMGIDHERLTYRYAGRDFRLTDVHGRVVREVLV